MSEKRTSLDRFEPVWRRRIASPPSPEPRIVHEQLRRLYCEEYRRFHNLDHIADCLGQLDRLAPLLNDPDAVELALWFHDAVYVPGAPDNERRSARLFLRHSAGGERLFRQRVCRLILATKHTGKAQGHDCRFMVDIDLSGFGAPWEEFMDKGIALREEFAVQPDAQYYAGQIAFLQRLRQRKAFFATDYFRQRCEQTAQDNLRRLLQVRKDQGYAPAP